MQEEDLSLSFVFDEVCGPYLLRITARETRISILVYKRLDHHFLLVRHHEPLEGRSVEFRIVAAHHIEIFLNRGISQINA